MLSFDFRVGFSDHQDSNERMKLNIGLQDLKPNSQTAYTVLPSDTVPEMPSAWSE